ncbi:MAG: GGDEF domain-containing protein [Steroidobacteraceae bacterium]|nr:GGDEF domain-containing protein [Steroidobacteraceae bacterium]
MNPEIATRVLSSINLPSPPGVAARIIEIAQDESVDMADVARAIGMDSALTSKILRIANSPLYAQRRKSENLRQALVVLGLNATLTLALSFSLVKSLRSGKPNGLNFDHYWRRSLLAATASRALADALRLAQAEEYFLVGLLQDIGMLGLDAALPTLYAGSDALQHDHGAIAVFERRLLQTDHTEVGAMMMNGWRLPERFCRAIGGSHEIHLRTVATSPETLDRCVALSGAVADLFLLDPQRRQFAENALAVERSIGLDKTAFGEVLAAIGSIIPETEAVFDADVLAKRSAELMLEQAREVLMVRSLHGVRDADSLRVRAEDIASRTLEIEQAARHDPLTGLYNRNHLDQILAREFEHSLRKRRPLSLAVAELENFKSICEGAGQTAGDRIVQAAARILRANTREADSIARHGAETFMLVMPSTNEDTARQICERIAQAFQSTPLENGTGGTIVTLFIGWATQDAQPNFANVAELRKAADTALATTKLRVRSRLVPFAQVSVPTAVG